MVREDGITYRRMGCVLRGEQLVGGIMVSTPMGRDALSGGFCTGETS